MASTNFMAVFTPLNNEPPASNYATLDTRNSIPVLDFDPTTDEEAIFGGVLPNHYGGGGLTVTVVWATTSGTSGNAVWQGAFESNTDDADDLDADSFASFNSSGAVAAPSATGEFAYDNITFTDGAQIDSLAAGESYRFKLRRDADNTSATDSLTATDLEVIRVIIKET